MTASIEISADLLFYSRLLVAGTSASVRWKLSKPPRTLRVPVCDTVDVLDGTANDPRLPRARVSASRGMPIRLYVDPISRNVGPWQIMEPAGIEPATSCLQSRRSPS